MTFGIICKVIFISFYMAYNEFFINSVWRRHGMSALCQFDFPKVLCSADSWEGAPPPLSCEHMSYTDSVDLQGVLLSLTGESLSPALSPRARRGVPWHSSDLLGACAFSPLT